MTARLGDSTSDRKVIYNGSEYNYNDLYTLNTDDKKTLEYRQFQNGRVVVNSSPTQSQTYTVPSNLDDDLGNLYPTNTTITLLPHTGRIFFNLANSNQLTIDNTNKSVTFKSSYHLTGIKTSLITKIVINSGQEIPTLVGTTTWQADVNLTLGDNAITIVGKDNSGGSSDPVTLNLNRHKPGDTNGDGYVDTFDFSKLATSWYKDPHIGTNYLADFNEDGYIDTFDFSLLATNWMK